MLQNTDYQILRYIHLHRFYDADAFMIYVTENATFITLFFILIIAGLYFVNHQKKYLWIAVNLVSMIIAGALVSNGIKLLVQRERPYDIYEDIHWLVAGGGYSFPSGYTTEVFVFLTGVWLLFNNKYFKIVALFWALLIAYSRMAMGVHYPADVLGGAVIGILTAVFWLRWNPFQKFFTI